MYRINLSEAPDEVPITFAPAALGTVYTEIAWARDFSVFDSGRREPARDPLAPERGIIAGKVELITDLKATNTDTQARWVDVGLRLEGSSATVQVPGRFVVSPGRTVLIPLRGHVLSKLDPASATGMRVVARAEVSGVFRLWIDAAESAVTRYRFEEGA